jgi:hypothetical protein
MIEGLYSGEAQIFEEFIYTVNTALLLHVIGAVQEKTDEEMQRNL